MKYMTKEWYETMQKTGIHSMLEIDERADKFSEDLYQELYEKGKMKHINFFDVPDNFEQFTEKYNKLGNIHEENLKAMYDKLVEELQRFTSDDYYSELLENKVKELKEKLTSEILNNVKDIRILALNYTTKEIYERIKEYCDNNRKYVEKMREDYDKILLEQFKDNLHAFVTEGFHD